MATQQLRSGPGGLLILYRQSASIDGAGTLVPNHIPGRLYYVAGPGGEINREYAFGVGGPVTHATTGVLTGSPSAIVGTSARTGAAVSHNTIGALIADSAIMIGTSARSGAAVSHDTLGFLRSDDAFVFGFASRGAPVTHDTVGILRADDAQIFECGSTTQGGNMAYSGTVSLTRFDTRRVIDNAYRRCRLQTQNISAEMQDYAKDALYLQLSELANGKPPSWCIEQVILPMYENQPVVPLPQGTVEVLNLNYRTVTALSGTVTQDLLLYQMDFESPAQVSTIGIKWECCSVAVSFDTQNDDGTWRQVGSAIAGAQEAGTWAWYDISQPMARNAIRITSAIPMQLLEVVFANNPSEIPMGVLNRDDYVNQANKIFPSRPTTYWFQRDLALPVLNLWPAPWNAAEHAQLILWRHRHVMDVGALKQSLEVPQRWMNSIIATLAATLAAETPGVDPALIPVLDQKAALALQLARDGDNDGSPTKYAAQIGVYTR